MIEYVYIIDNDRTGFYYIPYAGSMPLHGTLECPISELGGNLVICSSKIDCYESICKKTYWRYGLDKGPFPFDDGDCSGQA